MKEKKEHSIKDIKNNLAKLLNSLSGNQINLSGANSKINEMTRYYFILKACLGDSVLKKDIKDLKIFSPGCGDATEILPLILLSQDFNFKFTYIGAEKNENVITRNKILFSTIKKELGDNTFTILCGDASDKNFYIRNRLPKFNIVLYRHPLLFSHESKFDHQAIFLNSLPKNITNNCQLIVSCYEIEESKKVKALLKLTGISVELKDMSEVLPEVMNTLVEPKYNIRTQINLFANEPQVAKDDQTTYKEKYIITATISPIAVKKMREELNTEVEDEITILKKI